jgi:PKD repeat protein
MAESHSSIVRPANGQSVVEFALFLPVVLLLLMVAIDFGRAYLGWININLAAREAANYAALNPRGWLGDGADTIQDRYAQLVIDETTQINCIPDDPVLPPDFPAGATLGGSAIVGIDCRFEPLTPLVQAIAGNSVTISASAAFPIRTGGIASLPTSGDGGGIAPIPVANFAGDQLSGVAPLTVSFTDLSSNAPGEWAWTFGDGGTSVLQDPVHEYADAGVYTVSLTARNVNGEDIETKTGYITATEPTAGLVAAFTFAPAGGVAPLDVTFTDESLGAMSWEWDFGDGSEPSTEPEPTHRYEDAGTYVVRLTVEDAEGVTAFVDKTITISDAVCIVPNFSGVKVSAATDVWTDAGFEADAISFDGFASDNDKIYEQSLQGGLQTTCDATIEVGPEK